MQLVEIDEEFRSLGQTKAEYLLIMDTEGLRAPELTSNASDNLKHDNEMATTIMGLS